MLDREYHYTVTDHKGTRTLIVPKDELPYAGDPSRIVLDKEATSRTRLRDGGNPCWFIRLWHHFYQRKDPNDDLTFAEYCRRRHPDWIEVEGPATDANAVAIKATVAADRYHVTARHLRRLVDRGELEDLRPCGHADNAPVLVDEHQVAARWPRR
jgi:hypothetical protein